MRRSLLSVLILLCLAVDAAEVDIVGLYKHERENIDASSVAKDAARQEFIRLAKNGMLRTYPGEPLPANLDAAVLAEAIPSFIVTREDLVTYDGKSATSNLLQSFGEVVYLIRIDGEPVSTANMHRVGLSWQATSF